MGSCMGRCFLQRGLPSFQSHSDFYDNDFNFLVDEIETTVPSKPKKKNFMARILSKKKSTSKKHKKPVLELVEDLFHATPGSSYSRLSKTKPAKKPINPSFSNTLNQVEIPLQCLDVRALLSKTVEPPRSSTPGSSLDLEWEHETLPVSLHDPSISSWAALSEKNLPDILTSSSENTARGNPEISDWSRVSSADSLEWDPGQSETPTGSVDTDTRQLLQEIEILTDQALRETGMQLES